MFSLKYLNCFLLLLIDLYSEIGRVLFFLTMPKRKGVSYDEAVSDILRFVNNEDDVSDDDLEDFVGEIDSDDDSDVEIPTVGDTGMYKISGFVC